eukprot:TRINITY_DN43692_c0_g1_i1.p1 TRINITY_DN43692_c0_g1~~TRINITY_DN43692_c0_g1_i1.p1  ORF type:complete len:245 (+),score=41.00 TRINITY_DN43692_c0_g1_i1:34-768(+)
MSGYAQPRAMPAFAVPLPSNEDNSNLRIPEAPNLPEASPLGGLACPIGANVSPNLITPHLNNANRRREGSDLDSDGEQPPLSSAKNKLGSLGQMNEWAWEMGSEAGSVPSAWSKPSTVHSSVSRISSATGDGLIPGLVDGQRLSSVKPAQVPTDGGKVVVSLRREVPQGFWDRLGIVLVNGPVQKKLTPTGVKNGKKLCIEVPAGMVPGDYDVRLAFGEKIIHGAIPLTIGEGLGDDDDEDLDD